MSAPFPGTAGAALGGAPTDPADNAELETAPPTQTEEGAWERFLNEVGRMVDFTLETFREIPNAIRLYPAEIFRHAGMLVRQNSIVILFMMMMLGLLLGLTAHFIFIALGIDSYIAAAHTIGSLRGIIEAVFGWTVAAKIGCGIVAELGAMRISEEIDAMEVMGIRPITYLVAPRIIAAMFVMPLIFGTGLVLSYWAGWLMNVQMQQTVSDGGFWYFLFLFQNTRDFVGVMLYSAILSVILMLVASYYGFTAKGGPVGVGRNTAQSMMVNLVIVSMLGLGFVQVLYGASPNAPIGN